MTMKKENIDSTEIIDNFKMNLILLIKSLIHDMRQCDAAKLLDVAQPKVSLIKNLHIESISIDFLLTALLNAGYQITPSSVGKEISDGLLFLLTKKLPE